MSNWAKELHEYAMRITRHRIKNPAPIQKAIVVEGELWPGVTVKVWESGSYSVEDGTKHWLHVMYCDEKNGAFVEKIEIKHLTKQPL